MAEYKKLPKAVSPKGVAIWPKLNEPDDYKNKLAYKTRLAIDADDPDLAKLQAQVEELTEAKYAETVADVTEKLTKQGKKGLIAKKVAAIYKVSPFAAEEDGETGDETGRILLSAKMAAAGVSSKTGKPWTRKPSIFSASGKELKRPPMIGSGSVLKLSLELCPYAMTTDDGIKVGVSLRLEAVQLLTLVSFGQRDASGYGFGAEEGDDIDDVESGSDFAADTDSSDDSDDDL